MINITDFCIDHLYQMDIQPHQAWTRDLLDYGYGAFYQRGIARTVWLDGDPVACFGESIVWDGVGECWAILAGNIGISMVAVDRAVRALIGKVSTRRLQAYVDASFEPGVRWMLDLGFTVEGKLKRYLPNGNDAFLFALVRGDAVVPAAAPFSMINSYDEPDLLAKIMRLESEMAQLPQMEVETVHRFSHGIYEREITIPKGTLLTGKMHRTDHISHVLKGDISVLTEHGIERIRAPATIVSKAGMKRVGYAHEDTVWTTVHGTHETDLERLEEELIVPAVALTGGQS